MLVPEPASRPLKTFVGQPWPWPEPEPKRPQGQASTWCCSSRPPACQLSNSPFALKAHVDPVRRSRSRSRPSWCTFASASVVHLRRLLTSRQRAERKWATKVGKAEFRSRLMVRATVEESGDVSTGQWGRDEGARSPSRGDVGAQDGLVDRGGAAGTSMRRVVVPTGGEVAGEGEGSAGFEGSAVGVPGDGPSVGVRRRRTGWGRSWPLAVLGSTGLAEEAVRRGVGAPKRTGSVCASWATATRCEPLSQAGWASPFLTKAEKAICTRRREQDESCQPGSLRESSLWQPVS